MNKTLGGLNNFSPESEIRAKKVVLSSFSYETVISSGGTLLTSLHPFFFFEMVEIFILKRVRIINFPFIFALS